MEYINAPSFSYEEIVGQLKQSATTNDKFFYLRAGKAQGFPVFLQYLNCFLLVNNIATYIPHREKITRSTPLHYYFERLTYYTREEETHERIDRPLLFSQARREAFEINETIGIHFIEVVSQIQDTFEDKIPAWALETGATELFGVSLALKQTPKHRIRVYTRGDHIIVFTTKGVDNLWDTDFKLYRKLWACIPLIRGWVKPDEEPTHSECTHLCKLLDNDDATEFYTLLEHYYSNNPAITDLKYTNIISTFNNVTGLRQAHLELRIEDTERKAQERLQQYSHALEEKREAMRRLLELQNNDTTIAVDIIKMLVDKKICYALDVSSIQQPEGRISYRCSAPLLSYDKDAARILYNRRKNNGESQELLEIFKLLFLDEKVVLMFDQAIDVCLNTGTIQARNGHTRMNNNLNNCFPNPHHYNHNCWGSYGSVIVKLIHEFKLEEMFYQIKAAVGSFNFSDPPVVGGFLRMLGNIIDGAHNPACFYWRDENCTKAHTYSETIKHFREEIAE